MAVSHHHADLAPVTCAYLSLECSNIDIIKPCHSPSNTPNVTSLQDQFVFTCNLTLYCTVVTVYTACSNNNKILWRIDPLLSNNFVNSRC
jgi:hypothetical protein